MKRIIFMFFMSYNISFAQSSTLSSDIFKLINHSRTDPKDFLDKHKLGIQKYQAKYIRILMSAKPVAAAIWDKDLMEMCRAVIDENDLNPDYKGNNELCGGSSGKYSGSKAQSPLEYLCDMYTNINDKRYKYFGLYYNKNKENGMAFHWGMSCERDKKEFFYNEIIDSSSVDFKLLNTAAEIDYMTSEEKKMVQEINFVRKYPDVYAKIIATYLAKESKSYSGLNNDTYNAGIELIKELRKMPSLNILTPDKCIYEAAKKHGLDCKKRGYFAHEGSDKSNPWDRITQECPEYITGNENGSGGSGSPREHVIGLLLDDGISSRGHRYNIIDRRWLYVACYRFDNPKYKYQWVQNFGH